MKKPKIHKLIDSAFEATFQFKGWSFANEAEFKHELYHQLARLEYDGTPLGRSECGALTPRLHAEGKVENGNSAKADLLLCNPRVFQDFNYEVEHIIELKVSLTKRSLNEELSKLESYKNIYERIWLASLKPLKVSTDLIPSQHRRKAEIFLVSPDSFNILIPKSEAVIENASYSEVGRIVKSSIDKCLERYGDGRGQFQGYYWCNFEHEKKRGHNFPCEGDFNAQLYHNLRLNLNDSVRIHSEYRPKSLPQRRLDFLIEEAQGKWAIPIEVKMNWDQFKPKYKDKKPIRSEALTILDRFEAVRREFEVVQPILVVIQGEWRRKTDMNNKERALEALEDASIPLELFCFDEGMSAITHSSFGR